MINIVICEDEPPTRALVTQFVQDWAASRTLQVHILSYESAESFLFAYEENKNIDILLLDIQMKEMNGMELAKKLRFENNNVQIIFVTGFHDYISAGYDVDALHYLMKPVDSDKLQIVLDKAVTRMQQKKAVIPVKTSAGQEFVKISDICIIEAFQHYVKISLVTGKSLETRAKISDFEDLSADGFVRCHRSYIVNLNYVVKISKNDIILHDEAIVPLSRRMYNDVNREFIKHHTIHTSEVN